VSMMRSELRLAAFGCVILLLASCTPADSPTVDDMEDMDMESMEDMAPTLTDEEQALRDNAKIAILIPADGEMISGDSLEVFVEIQDVEEIEGIHWHAYVDGEIATMVMSGELSTTLVGLSAGEHEITAYLSDGTHGNIGQSDSVTVTVEP